MTPGLHNGTLTSLNHKNRLYKRLIKVHRDTPLFITRKQEFNAFKNLFRKMINQAKITIFQFNSKKIKKTEKNMERDFMKR